MHKSFPYPFLNNSDDVNADFSVISTPTSIVRGHELVIQFGLFITRQIVDEIISSGDAAVSVRWRCQGTLEQGIHFLDFSEAYNERSWHEICIDSNRIVGSVEFSVLLIATRSNNQFRWPGQNAEYEDFAFSIENGNVIGSAGKFTVTLSPAYDPMQGGLDSIFRIEPIGQSGSEFGFDLDGDYIRVLLPNEIAQSFKSLGSFPELQLSTVILPVLALAANEVFHSDQSGNASKRWFVSLQRQIERTGVDGDPIIAAQRLLGSPLVSAINMLSDFASEEEDDE